MLNGSIIKNDLAKCLNESREKDYVVVVGQWKKGKYGYNVYGEFKTIEDAKKFVEDDHARMLKKAAKQVGKSVEEIKDQYELKTQKENKYYYSDIASWEIRECPER